MKYWIKERRNPQLGTYWVGCGPLAAKEAKKRESSIYGFNVMHGYDTETAYLSRLSELRRNGERVQ
jgi:hypothetical protein